MRRVYRSLFVLHTLRLANVEKEHAQLSPEERLAFDVGFALKRSKRVKRTSRDEDPFPAIARHLIDHLRLAGWRFEHVKTQSMLEPTGVLETYRTNFADARAALRMIREALEIHCPPGTIPAEEMIEPPFTAEAKVLVMAVETLKRKHCER